MLAFYQHLIYLIEIIITTGDVNMHRKKINDNYLLNQASGICQKAFGFR
jgi:hypothetical protein